MKKLSKRLESKYYILEIRHKKICNCGCGKKPSQKWLRDWCLIERFVHTKDGYTAAQNIGKAEVKAKKKWFNENAEWRIVEERHQR